MHRQALLALAHPVFGPERQMRPEFNWRPERNVSAGLSCNIGYE